MNALTYEQLRKIEGLSDQELFAKFFHSKNITVSPAKLKHMIMSSFDHASSVSDRAAKDKLILIQAKFLGEILKRCLKEDLVQAPTLSSPEKVIRYCRFAMGSLTSECVKVFFLNRKHKLICENIMWTGDCSHVQIYPREVARECLRVNASAVILTHNHPSGDPTPSHEDLRITQKVHAVLKVIGVRLLDHLVISRTQTTSLAQLGAL